MSARPLRVTLVNQYYPPEVPPTALLAASLAEHLAAQGHRVTVLTGGEGYVDAPSGVDEVADDGDVHVVRLWTPALGKGSIAKRLGDYVSFLVGATVRLVTLPRQDVVVSLTTPPFVVVGAVAHKLLRRRTRVVLWSMDCYPDVIERLGSRTAEPPVSLEGAPVPVAARTPLLRRVLRTVGRPLLSLRRGGPISRVLRTVNRWAFRRLDHVVALDPAMRDLLVEGYGSADGAHPPSTIIPNWEAAAEFPAGRPVDRPWPGYDDPALADRFVVLYLGNLGYGHRVETVVEAAAALDDADRTALLFIGGGARWEQLASLAEGAGAATTVIQRPYVTKADTHAVMAGAGCALILLADEALGVMSPSKLHANLAAGLPIVYVGPVGSNVDEAIQRFGCGISLRTGDAAGLVAALRRLRDDAPWRAELAAAARTAFDTAYCDEATLPRWDAVLAETFAASR